MPVPLSGSTKSAGRTGTAVLVIGLTTSFHNKSVPDNSVSILTEWFWCSNVSMASRLTTHSSESIWAFTYRVLGLTQMFVTPKIVSGRRVEVGYVVLSLSNLTTWESPISGSTPPWMATTPTGFLSFGHQETGRVP